MCPSCACCFITPAMSIINKSWILSLPQLSYRSGASGLVAIFVAIRLSSVEVFPDLHLAKVQGGAQQGQLDVTWKSVGVHWGLNLRIHMIYIWFGTWLWFFHSVGNFIIPTDELFSEALKPPTSIYIYIWWFYWHLLGFMRIFHGDLGSFMVMESWMLWMFYI